MQSNSADAASEPFSRIRGWITQLGWLLVPPFAEPTRDDLLDRVRTELNVEAAALFLTKEDDPNQLRFVSGVGYNPDYHNTVYFLNQPALTPHVFSTSKAINLSHIELDAEQEKRKRGEDGVPYSGACAEYITTGRFLNIVAAPVVFEGNPLGVLKLENKKGTGPGDRFPGNDLAMAELLADMIAIVCQQRVYTRLWTEGEVAFENCSTVHEYLNRVSEILRKALNAECCSLFIREDSEEGKGSRLKYGGGVGYKNEYTAHTYELPDGDQPAKSLTAHIAQRKICIRHREKVLASSGLPYTGACRRYIASGTFRNILGMPLSERFGEDNASYWGVLKLENRKPEGTDFGTYDEEVCKAFVTKQIVPALKKFEGLSKGRSQTRALGVEALEKRLGPPLKPRDVGFGERFRQVLDFKKTEDISNNDVISYLKISRARFYRLKRVNA
jgi:hypothetical protein